VNIQKSLTRSLLGGYCWFERRPFPCPGRTVHDCAVVLESLQLNPSANLLGSTAGLRRRCWRKHASKPCVTDAQIRSGTVTKIEPRCDGLLD
jgi:hypothetical protein